MCGIVGFITDSKFTLYRDQLETAVSSLSHRGPDDSGLFFDEKAGVGLAHRRLSIIDLSAAGHQPMCSDDQRIWISYNGEIYNFKAIRATLKSQGYRFRSGTDTEVALKAYMHWGSDCLKYFQGMFALAIWDGIQRQLFLARDRIGIKPLYYSVDGNALLFGSELKALMAFSEFPRDVDLKAIALFLHYQYIPTPRTIFKNTFKLPPGHFLIKTDKALFTKAYWQLPDVNNVQNDPMIDEMDHIEKLDQLLSNAVSDRLVSDVPLGALLSGGIDSSAVAALMQKTSTASVRTFSIGFHEKAYNEAPWAAKVADHLGTDHTELYVSPKEALDVIPELPYIYDEPFADSSAVPTYLVSKLTRSQVTVALSGDGGDEQFCGYVRYWSTEAMDRAFHSVPKPLKNVLAAILNYLPLDWIERQYLIWRRHLPQKFYVANFQDKWQKLIKLMRRTEIQELYRMTICQWTREDIRSLCGQLPIESTFERIFSETTDWPILSRLMRVDQRTYLPDAMLTKVDRASMATGLEVRVPLLDHRVLEFTATMPDNLKFKNGNAKYLLRKVLDKYLPHPLYERPKMGFGVPIDHWLRNELKELLLDYLSPDRLKKEGLFNPELIEERINEHLSGKNNHHYRLWTFLMWEMWRDKWLN